MWLFNLMAHARTHAHTQTHTIYTNGKWNSNLNYRYLDYKYLYTQSIFIVCVPSKWFALTFNLKCTLFTSTECIEAGTDIAYNINNINTPRHDSISTKIHYVVAPTYPPMWRMHVLKPNGNGFGARHFPLHQILYVCRLNERLTDRNVFSVQCSNWQMTLCILLTFENGANEYRCRCRCRYRYRYIYTN